MPSAVEFRLEMQSPGSEARLGPKFRLDQAFCGARTNGVGLMSGSNNAITVCYALAAGLRALLETF